MATQFLVIGSLIKCFHSRKTNKCQKLDYPAKLYNPFGPKWVNAILKFKPIGYLLTLAIHGLSA